MSSMMVMTDPLKPIPNPLGELLERVRIAMPPVLAELRRAAEQLNTQLSPTIEALKAAQTVIDNALPPSELRRLFERIEESSRWMRQAPATLQTALAGRTVVHQELSLPDIAAIVRAFNEGGAEAAVSKVQELHEGLLADTAFRERFGARWQAADRGQIMSDVLAAYDAGLYYAAIPPALAQTEGVVAEFFGLSNLKLADLKPRIQQLHADDQLLEPLVTSFVVQLLVPFDHGKPVPQLNRHAVQHGGDKAYGTKANAVAAIIWADYMLGVTIEAAAKRDAALPEAPESR